MRVLYIHQHFSTPDGATGTRSYEMARQLIERGHRVTMVCGSARVAATGLTGEFRRGVRRGEVNGIEVIEVQIPYSNRQNFVQRSVAFARFAWRSALLALREPCDLVFATSTPLTAAIPGIVSSFIRRRPFVFEVRDLWPELPRAMGVITNPAVLLLISVLEWVAYRAAWACIGLSPGIVAGIRRRRSRDGPVYLIPNGCDLDLFGREGGSRWRPPQVATNDLMAVFTGAHGIANGLDAVLDAAVELKRRGRSDIKLVLVGDGMLKLRLQERAAREELANVVFLDPIPKVKLTGLLRAADVGLMILKNVPAFYYGTSPNKFFDYIAAAKPVLNNYPGWLAELIAESGCGIAVPPEDPAQFAAALERMADDREALRKMGDAARRLAEQRFDRRMLADKFVDALEETYQRATGAAPRASSRDTRRYEVGKRLFDLALALLLLVPSLPVLAMTALAVRLAMGSPVLFIQTRIGRGGIPFRIYKFRTMTEARDAQGRLSPDEQRLTALGLFLRRTSLDELPQIFNVLRGDLSFVGPRPLLPEYLPLYSAEHARRHEVMPGITGWAQINGRNAVTWEQRLAADIWYVEHRSFALDLKILLLTVGRVLRAQNIAQPGQATMQPFTGSGAKRREDCN